MKTSIYISFCLLFATVSPSIQAKKLTIKDNTAGRISSRSIPLTQPATPAPKPSAAAVVVIDPMNLKVIYSYKAHQKRQVASTQKIITALCVLDAGRLDEALVIQSSDLKAPPYKMGFKPGARYTRRDLLRALLTASHNDVALALARGTAGSVSKFVARMNARAKRMGMKNTYFANPHGLPAKQYSTAYDMALAASYAYRNPFIRRVTDSVRYAFPFSGKSKKTLTNTNELLAKYHWVNGMKTGYTRAAGRCLISSGTLNGRSVIVVVLGSTHAKIWGESLKYLKWALRVK